MGPKKRSAEAEDADAERRQLFEAAAQRRAAELLSIQQRAQQAGDAPYMGVLALPGFHHSQQHVPYSHHPMGSWSPHVLPAQQPAARAPAAEGYAQYAPGHAAQLAALRAAPHFQHAVGAAAANAAGFPPCFLLTFFFLLYAKECLISIMISYCYLLFFDTVRNKRLGIIRDMLHTRGLPPLRFQQVDAPHSVNYIIPYYCSQSLK
jgi:hypothetical protein